MGKREKWMKEWLTYKLTTASNTAGNISELILLLKAETNRSDKNASPDFMPSTRVML